MYKIQFIGFSKGKVLKGIETLILILILERKKAGSSIPGTSLLDCLKNGRFDRNEPMTCHLFAFWKGIFLRSICFFCASKDEKKKFLP